MPSAPNNRQAIIPGLLLFSVVLVLFLPALKNGFVNYDDPQYVTENAHVQGGLTWAGVQWAFRGGYSANWHPLTWISHMADCQLYGLSPWGHHLSSVLLHACNALLLFLVLRRMTGATWRSLAVAALFGLHPLHVESVAWVSERKDVLSALFWMLTLGAYAAWAPPKGGRRKAEGGNGIYYVLALLFLALGLMSKAMLVSVPFVLLLLDYWPLGRFQPSAGISRWRMLARLFGEKIPFFAMAAADSVVTILVQKHAGAMGETIGIPLGVRIENALISYCRYLGGIFCPARLAVFYPYPDSWPVAQALGAAALLLGITIAAVALRRKHPYVLIGWLWFLVTLGPVIGLVQVGSQSMADRYTYIPSIGVFVFLAWGVHALTIAWRRQAVILGVAAAAALAGCALLTSRQIAYWKDSETLFRHALAVTENNWLAHDNLGNALSKNPDRQREAIAQYEDALRIRPGIAETRNNLGIALAQTGDGRGAAEQFQEALRLNPNNFDAHYNLGNLLRQAGRLPEAGIEYGEALRLNPGSSMTHNNLGSMLLEEGKTDEAIGQYGQALRLNPDLFEAQNNLGLALAATGRISEAEEHFEQAVRIRPDDVTGHYNLGCSQAELGRTSEAGAQFERVLQLDPNNAQARANLERLRGRYLK